MEYKKTDKFCFFTLSIFLILHTFIVYANNIITKDQFSTKHNLMEQSNKDKVADINNIKQTIKILRNTETQNSNTKNKKQFTKIHIASYKDEKSAYQGGVILQNKYNNSYYYQIEINYENIKDKGWYYRIYFIGESEKIIPLCERIKKSGDWCNIVK